MKLSKKIVLLFLLVLIGFSQIPALHAYVGPLSGISGTTPPQPGTQCVWTKPLACGVEIINWAINQISLLAAKIIRYFVILTAAFMQMMISINSKVLQADIVQSGYPITLNLANLGFVIAILLIAFGTILRYESYHIKKTLVKVVVMALLINFGLLIAGIFIDFSNLIAQTFFDAASYTGSSEQFASDLAQTLNLSAIDNPKPQNLLDPSEDLNSLSVLGETAFKFIVTTISSALFSFLTAIVFAATAFMVMVRYFAIILLVIFLPLAWMFWAIPDFSHLTKRWWSEFLRWIFFLPAMAFFFYLAISTADRTKRVMSADLVVNEPANASETLNLVEDSAQKYIQIFVLSALMMGGLLAANSFGIHGAGAFISMAEKGRKRIIGTVTAPPRAVGRGLVNAGAGVVNGAANLTGELGRRALTFPFRTERGRGLIGGLRELQNSNSFFVRQVGRLGNLGTKTTKGADTLVKDAIKKQANESIAELSTHFGTMFGPEQVAFLERAVKEGKVGDIKNLAKIITNPAIKAKMTRYGKEDSYKKLEKMSLMNTEMLQTAQQLAEAQSSGNAEAINKFTAALKTATLAHLDKYSQEDFKTAHPGIIKPFDKDKAFAGMSEGFYDTIHESATRAILETNPGMVVKILPKLSAKDFKKTTAQIRGFIDDIPDAEKRKAANDALKKTIGNRVSGFSDDDKTESEREVKTESKAEGEEPHA